MRNFRTISHIKTHFCSRPSLHHLNPQYMTIQAVQLQVEHAPISFSCLTALSERWQMLPYIILIQSVTRADDGKGCLRGDEDLRKRRQHTYECQPSCSSRMFLTDQRLCFALTAICLFEHIMVKHYKNTYLRVPGIVLLLINHLNPVV